MNNVKDIQLSTKVIGSIIIVIISIILFYIIKESTLSFINKKEALIGIRRKD